MMMIRVGTTAQDRSNDMIRNGSGTGDIGMNYFKYCLQCYPIPENNFVLRLYRYKATCENNLRRVEYFINNDQQLER